MFFFIADIICRSNDTHAYQDIVENGQPYVLRSIGQVCQHIFLDALRESRKCVGIYEECKFAGLPQ